MYTNLSAAMLRTAALAGLIGAWTVTTLAGPLTAVVTAPGNLEIQLTSVGNLGGLVPIDAASIAGDPKLYVGTYVAATASVRVVDPTTSSVSPTPFLTFAGTGVPITGQGLQGITFSPNFNDSTQPGYRKFYTYQAETSASAASVMFLHPEVPTPATVGVVREWTANAAGTAIDTSIASRVVFNFGTPAGHMGGGMKFGPDGYLYLATGDGGGNGDGGSTSNNTDGFTGRNPTGTATDVPGISNAQDFTNVLGKVVRIDPYTSNADGAPRATPAGAVAKSFGGTTRYFIPGSNPFVGNSQNLFFTPVGPVESQTPVAPLAELYAFGFRNPWKLSFDKNAVAGDAPYVADVGSRQREEIVRVEAGNNYGWPYREGEIASGAANGRPLTGGNLPFLKQVSPGVYASFDLDPTLSDPTQMSSALALLGTRSGSGSPLVFADRVGNDIDSDGIYGNSYGDANSVTGGFVYRGTGIPALAGMYVFGVYQYLIDDPTRDPATSPATSNGGRLLYFDPSDAAVDKTIREFNFSTGHGINNTRITGTTNTQGDLLSIAEGSDGELYALFLNGDVMRLDAPLLAGDYNNDGAVDAADYTVWRDRVGSSEPLANDPIGGIVGNGQYEQWKNNFGAGGGGAAAAASVPEPAAGWLLLAIGGFLAAACRRRSPWLDSV